MGARPMFDWTSWFRKQLGASADAFVWAYSRIEPYRHEQLPPDANYMGTWPPARLVWHVSEYERCLVLPTMKQWLGGEMPRADAWPDSDVAWRAVRNRSFDTLVSAFLKTRQQQIDLLDDLAGFDWEGLYDTGWGPRSLAWVVTKTYQHTFEHGDTLLRMNLWWDIIEQENAAGNR